MLLTCVVVQVDSAVLSAAKERHASITQVVIRLFTFVAFVCHHRQPGFRSSDRCPSFPSPASLGTNGTRFPSTFLHYCFNFLRRQHISNSETKHLEGENLPTLDMQVVTLLLALFIALVTVCSTRSNGPSQVPIHAEDFNPIRTKFTDIQCDAAFPKAPRSDCEALLAEISQFPDSDGGWCASLCFDRATKKSHSFGTTEIHGTCRLTMLTNVITGDFNKTDLGHRCGGMYVDFLPIFFVQF
jgi:hypothetical protein